MEEHMKTLQRLLTFAVILCGVMLVAGCEDGSYFDADTKQIKADAVSRIEATGMDLRLYEFTPRTAPNKQCIFVAGEKKAGLVCWDKIPSE
jgi:hypothetical protein